MIGNLEGFAFSYIRERNDVAFGSKQSFLPKYRKEKRLGNFASRILFIYYILLRDRAGLSEVYFC